VASNPLSPTKFKTLLNEQGFFAFVGLISAAPSGNIGDIADGGMDALSCLQAQFHPGVYGVSNPIFDLHFVYKNCAPLPTDC